MTMLWLAQELLSQPSELVECKNGHSYGWFDSRFIFACRPDENRYTPLIPKQNGTHSGRSFVSANFKSTINLLAGMCVSSLNISTAGTHSSTYAHDAISRFFVFFIVSFAVACKELKKNRPLTKLACEECDDCF